MDWASSANGDHSQEIKLCYAVDLSQYANAVSDVSMDSEREF